MATFQAQVEGITGLTIGTTPTTGELTQFLQDGLDEVINRIIRLKPDEVSKFTATTNSHTHITKTGTVLSVMREHDSTTILRNCAPMDPALRYESTDVESLHYKSKYNPGFFELDGNIHIRPAASGTGDNDIIVTQVAYDTGVAFGDSVPDNFPSEYVYLVSLYASIKALQSALASKNSDLPSNLAVPTMPVKPTPPTMSEKTVSITGTAPTYQFQVLDLPTLSIADLSITAVAPAAPTLSSISVSFSATVPTYTSPILTLDDDVVQADISTLTSIGVPVAPSLSSVSVDTSSLTIPTYLPPVPPALDFNDAGTNWITDEEDPEMSSARVNVINAQIQDYMAKLQDATAEFNKDSLIYQQEINVAIQDSTMTSNEDTQKLSKYGNEIQIYTQEVNTKIQEYTTNLGKNLQIYTMSTNAKAVKYQADIQNALNSFNKEHAAYQAELQKSLQDADLLSAGENRKIQKFQSELQDYTNKVSKEVQEYQQNFQKELGIWQGTSQNKIGKHQADIQNALNVFNKENVEYQALLQKDITDGQLAESKEGRDLQKYASQIQDYNAEVSGLIQKFGAQVQDYSAKLQKLQLDYGWMEARMTKLQQEYDGAFMVMAPKQQQQQGGGGR